MPWRLPVGLDALLPSCRACKAAALLVWHRHAEPHRRDPLRRSHAPSTSLHRVAVPCSTPSPRHAPTPALGCRSVSFCGASSLPFADVPPSCLHFAPPGLPPFPSTGCLRFAPRGHLHSAPRGCLRFAPRGCLRFAPRVGSTSLHRCDEARKTADLRHRSPSPGGELQQKCEAMGTVALHPGFPLMRMIFFDKTPLRDPCLWGEVE